MTQTERKTLPVGVANFLGQYMRDGGSSDGCLSRGYCPYRYFLPFTAAAFSCGACSRGCQAMMCCYSDRKRGLKIYPDFPFFLKFLTENSIWFNFSLKLGNSFSNRKFCTQLDRKDTGHVDFCPPQFVISYSVSIVPDTWVYFQDNLCQSFVFIKGNYQF